MAIGLIRRIPTVLASLLAPLAFFSTANAAPIAAGGFSEASLSILSLSGGIPTVDFIIGPPGPPAVDITKSSGGDGNPDEAPFIGAPPPGFTAGSALAVGPEGAPTAIVQFALALAQVDSIGFASSDVLTTGAIEITNAVDATTDIIVEFLFEWDVAAIGTAILAGEETRGQAGVGLSNLEGASIPLPPIFDLIAEGVFGSDVVPGSIPGSFAFSLTIAPGETDGVITLVDANAFASAVSAPATILLLGLGLAALGAAARRRASQR